MNRFTPFFVITIVLVLSIISSVSAKDNQAEKAKLDNSKESYIFEKIRVKLRYDKDGTGTREINIRVKLQNADAIEEFGHLSFKYNEDTEKLEIDSVIVIKPNGEKITVTTNNNQYVTVPEFGNSKFYTDLREKHFTVPDLRPGDTLEYRVVCQIITPPAPNNFWVNIYINKSPIILDELVEINIPSNIYVKLKTEKDFEPIIREEGDRIIYQWKRANLTYPNKKVDNEIKRDEDGYIDPLPPQIQLTTFKTWEEVGKWYSDLIRERLQPGDKIRAKANELTQNLKSDQEKIETLYKFVSQKFRNLSFSFGQGRFQPHAASEVLRNQFGDSKDKHTLFASLLKVIGINADTVLINNSSKIDPDVPSPEQFNDVITSIHYGNELWWVDTTVDIYPFRLLARSLRKKQVLLIPENAPARLEITPSGFPFQLKDTVIIEGKVGEMGEFKGNINCFTRGEQEILHRLLFSRSPKSDPVDIKNRILNWSLNDADISDIKYDDPLATEKPFHVQFNFVKSGFIDRSLRKQQINLPLPSAPLLSIDEKDNNKSKSIKIGEPIESSVRIKIEFPVGYKVRLPIPITLNKEFAEYKSTYSLEGNVFTAEKYLKLKSGDVYPSGNIFLAEHYLNLSAPRVSPERLKDYINFYGSVIADQNQTITLETDSINTSSILEISSIDTLLIKASAAAENNDFKWAEQLLNRVIIKDPKNQKALYQLTSIFYEQRKFESAIKTAKDLIAIGKIDNNIYRIIGDSYWGMKKFDEAEAAFKKFLESSPLDGEIRGSLGLVLLESKKYKEAISELEKAISLYPDMESVYEAGKGRAYLNLNQTDKAMESFDNARKLDSDSTTLNNIAYFLALSNVELDKALLYAESAVNDITGQMRNVELKTLSIDNLNLIGSLSRFWDTLGLAHFKKGNLEKSLNYFRAAWYITWESEVADHIGQLYEKQGDNKQAAEWYAIAIAAQYPIPDAKLHFSNLVSENKADSLLKSAERQLKSIRIISLQSPFKNLSEKLEAEFFIVLTPNEDASQISDSIFISGSEKLRTMTNTLNTSSYLKVTPENSNVKIIRRGTLTCHPGDNICKFELHHPDDAISIN